MDTTQTPKRWLQPLFIFLCLSGLFLWQGWMTLSLFGVENPWQRLHSNEPLVSGQHPLHQYHGHLGAQAVLQTGSCCCYDPAFQAGYPKTPIFDSGSRPAELFMLFAGGDYDPKAYKIGLAAVCLLFPVLLIIAARGAGLCGWATVVAMAMGQLLWWGVPAQEALKNGDLDLLASGILLATHVGLLIRYDRKPGLVSWFGLLLTGILGWFAHPLLFMLVAPLVLVFYLTTGAKHKTISWHFGLAAAQCGAVLANFVWLSDWVSYWWVHAPLSRSPDLLPHRTIRTIWEAPLWGAPADRALAVTLMVTSLAGVFLFDRRKQRSTARLLMLAGGGLLLLAISGISWEFWGKIGAASLLIPTLWFSVLASAYAVVEFVKMSGHSKVSFWLGSLALTIAIGTIAVAGRDHVSVWAERCQRAGALEIGLGEERNELVQQLVRHTNTKARILWEDRPSTTQRAYWSALLPLLTGRSFIGGLDPGGRIEHSHGGFAYILLSGKPISMWLDSELDAYCRRYNIGWVVAWSPAGIKRFQQWQQASVVETIKDGDNGVLFAVKRQQRSFALEGQATVLEANGKRISLANVKPDKDGKVVLSFHYQTGLRAAPSRVKIEREPDVLDPVPLLRLRVAEPVSRLTLTWERR